MGALATPREIRSRNYRMNVKLSGSAAHFAVPRFPVILRAFVLVSFAFGATTGLNRFGTHSQRFRLPHESLRYNYP